MNENFRFYERLLYDQHDRSDYFWDVVVITAMNQRQKQCYEKQIEAKLKSSKLPKQFEYRVIDDPCSSKIGSGGSTLNVILQLYKAYGERLLSMKILLVIF
jgi:hypothetical protein